MGSYCSARSRGIVGSNCSARGRGVVGSDCSAHGKGVVNSDCSARGREFVGANFSWVLAAAIGNNTPSYIFLHSPVVPLHLYRGSQSNTSLSNFLLHVA